MKKKKRQLKQKAKAHQKQKHIKKSAAQTAKTVSGIKPTKMQIFN
jgi:hypothetical protein